MITFDELTKMSPAELEKELERSKFELMKLRLAVKSRQSEATAELKGLRKYIARINTIQSMRKREIAPENAQSAVTK